MSSPLSDIRAQQLQPLYSWGNKTSNNACSNSSIRSPPVSYVYYTQYGFNDPAIFYPTLPLPQGLAAAAITGAGAAGTVPGRAGSFPDVSCSLTSCV